MIIWLTYLHIFICFQYLSYCYFVASNLFQIACFACTDKPQKETSHKDLTAQPQGSTAYESKPSRTTAVSRKDELSKREQEERQFYTSDEPAAATKQLNKKKSVEFDVPDKMITSCNRQMQAEPHCMCSQSDCHLQQAHDRQDSSKANITSAYQNKCQPSRQQADGSNGGFPLEREEKRKNSPMRTCEDSLQESKSSEKDCSQRVEKWQHELGQDCRPRESENPKTEFKMKPMEMHEHQLRHEVCDECRARGKRVCDCSRIPRSYVAHSKPLTVTFAPEVSSSDKSYSCQQEQVSLTSKFSFMEMDSHMDYGSSMRESENAHEFSKREFIEGPLTYPPMTMLKNPPPHQSSKKTHFSLPSVDSFYNQNQHHKTTCDLPDEVLAYLARQRCFRREMYYNNNNRSDNHLHDATLAADSSDSDHQPCNGQSLSKSGQALSSNGQSAYQSEVRPVSDEKPQRTLVLHKEESVFVQENGLQKNRLQNQDHFRNERRNMLEVGNKDVTDNHKRNDDDTNRCDDHGKTTSDAIQRFDVQRFGDNYKRSDDVENKCSAGNKRSSDDSHRRADDSLRRFDDTQRRSDDNRRRYDHNKPRFCCENGCDNSANNSNTKSATFCSQSLSCDMRATQSDSKHGLSFLKKMQHSQEKKLEIRGEFYYQPTSQETQNDRNSVKGSYFCPEESEPENEGCANSQSLADDKKPPLAHVRSCGHVSLKVAQFKTGAGLLLQNHTSWHTSEMPQVVQTVLPSTNKDGSGAQNDTSGTIASLGQAESDCRSCEMKGKSGVTSISGRGRSDSRFCVLEGSNTMSSRHRNSRSCEQEGRSPGVLSSTQKQLEPRTFEQDGDSFTLYSPQEQSNNQSLQLQSRSDVTSRDQSSSNSLQPKDTTGNTVSSIHKQANNGFCDLHHTTREDSDNSKHGTSIMTPHVIVGQCEIPYSGNSNQQDMSFDQSSGKMSAGDVRQRSCNDSLEVTHHSFRNCCFSSEIVKSNSALRSDKSCVLGRDSENANKNNNTGICNCSHENCLCSG